MRPILGSGFLKKTKQDLRQAQKVHSAQETKQNIQQTQQKDTTYNIGRSRKHTRTKQKDEEVVFHLTEEKVLCKFAVPTG